MKDDKQQKIFTKNLNKFMAATDKSQREIASAVGVSPQTFNTWCQGIALPRMGKIQALADYFKINKSDLIEEHANTPLEVAQHNAVSDIEYEHIEKYRSLDGHGKKVVDFILEEEYTRSSSSAVQHKDASAYEAERISKLLDDEEKEDAGALSDL